MGRVPIRFIPVALRGAGAVSVLVLALGAPGGAQSPSPFAPLPLQVVSPPDNPSTPEKVALGRLLFWDPILSGGGDVACATCHHPEYGYSDGRALPIGVGGTGIGPKRTAVAPAGLVKRNSPTLLNVAFNGLVDPSIPFDPTQAPMFWDSRVRGLEAQSLAPIETFEEMRGREPAGTGVAAAVARIAAVPEYQQLFARAFGGADAVSAVTLSRAIAAFERSLVTSDSRFDRYLRGDTSALTAGERYGMQAFEKQGCTLCHRGPMLSDYQLHVLGVPDNPALGARDPGAGQRFAFRTPTLRNLAYTAPYMHSGTFDYVDTVVAGFYRRPAGPGLDPLLQQVAVESNSHDIVAFLATLNGTYDSVDSDARAERPAPRWPIGLRGGARRSEVNRKQDSRPSGVTMRTEDSSMRRLSVLALVCVSTVFVSAQRGVVPMSAPPPGGYIIQHDDEVAKVEPGTHDGGGETVGYSFFAHTPNLHLVFRKRALKPGSGIGYHKQSEDEIYYVLSGHGLMTLDGRDVEVGPGTAILTRTGSSHGLKQTGSDDLVILINYLQ